MIGEKLSEFGGPRTGNRTSLGYTVPAVDDGAGDEFYHRDRSLP